MAHVFEFPTSGIVPAGATINAAYITARVSGDVRGGPAANRGDLPGLRHEQGGPIAFSQHLHHRIVNTSTTNSSTGESRFDNISTSSCNMPWLTSAGSGWFPVEMDEPVRAVNVYYRAPGDQTKIKAIPKGLQLLATGQKYDCGGAPGDAVPFQDSPVYSCTENWATSVTFADPRCGEGRSHADYFAANEPVFQPVFNEELLDDCIMNVPDWVTEADQPAKRG